MSGETRIARWFPETPRMPVAAERIAGLVEQGATVVSARCRRMFRDWPIGGAARTDSAWYAPRWQASLHRFEKGSPNGEGSTKARRWTPRLRTRVRAGGPGCVGTSHNRHTRRGWLCLREQP